MNKRIKPSHQSTSLRKQPLDPGVVELIKRIVVGLFVLGGLGLFISALWYGTRIDALTIVEVTVSGGETIDLRLVEEVARKELEGSYLGIVPKSFAWFYPAEKIQSKLSQIPRLHEVSVARPSGKELLISFTEYVPYALWCNTPESEACLFIDNAGFSFASAPALKGGSFIRFSRVGQEAKLNEQITDTHDLSTLTELVDLLALRQWYVSHVEIGQSKDLFLHIVGGGELKVTMEESAEKTADNLLTIIASEQFSHLSPGNFQYVDLRYGDKVYINEEAVAVEVPAETDIPDAGAPESVEGSVTAENTEADPTPATEVVVPVTTTTTPATTIVTATTTSDTAEEAVADED